ncbi:GNAT family N-acetyltransferase [Candidatus Pacearchaeota archaeon]|nr:GNAT family N-acetyltransferase [Candidatus Pacearchaeota archaeon]
MNEIENINIREFQKKDLGQVVDICVYAFYKKFHKTLNLKKEDLANFLIDLGIVPSFSQPGYFIAEIDDKIIGVLILSWKRQKLTKTRIDYFSLFSKYGWKNVIDTMIGLIALDIKPKKEICIFKSMAIIPDMQKRGFAAKLAKYGIEYAKKEGFKKIALRIASSNTKAINHIERLNFRIKKEEKIYYSKIFFGIEKWHYYELLL